MSIVVKGKVLLGLGLIRNIVNQWNDLGIALH